MKINIVQELLRNFEILLIASILYEASSVISIRLRKTSHFIEGILIGLIGIILIMNPFQFSAGLFIDSRSILLASTSLVFGPETMFIATFIMIIYRISLGGVGTMMGVAIILLSTLLGFFWKNRFSRDLKRCRIWSLLQFGFLVHIGMIVTMFLLPHEMAIFTIENLWVEILSIFPISTVLISMLLLAQKDHTAYQWKTIEAEDKYRSIFDNGHAPMMLLDPNSGEIRDVNQAATKYYGWSKEQMLKMNIGQINTLPLDLVKTEMKKSESREKGIFTFQHRKADGTISDVEVSSGPIFINQDVFIYSIVHDISERVASEKALKDSESRFKLVVETAPDAIFIQIGGKFGFVNNACLEIFGANNPDELIGRNVLDQIDPEYRQSVLNRIQILNHDRKAVEAVEEAFLRLDGSRVDVEAVAVPITYEEIDGAMVFARDISTRKKLENEKLAWQAQIRQQQKLEAIGTLAGGVAHEINNPLNVIMNFAQLVVDEAEAKSEPIYREYGIQIIEESERVSGIVRNLLQFSRQEKQSHSYASVYDIVNRTISLINTIIKKDQIKLKVEFENDLPQMKCRSQQIQQVLMNLLTNSRDSLNDKYPGFSENKIINIKVYRKDHDSRRWINLVVEDFGNGIPDDVMDKMFEPFFSTKPKEKGTGLGLSISFGIINDHHGSIRVETELNQYARFIVELPVDNGWEME